MSAKADDGSVPRLRLQLSDVCQRIAASASNASSVYDTASANYLEDIYHWASSSTQASTCSFEPGTAEDVGIALQILGQSRTPFAVKGGGHTGNPEFSSTSGVQIAMSIFSEVSYNPTAQTVTIGAGLVWDDVYRALEPYRVNVVGGKVTGVGVAGLTLGGGYSWLTNQYGLTVDTVQAYELVMPNSTVINVTETTSPDLFFALKGGLNNFTQVWGGLITYTADVLDRVNMAVANFVANNSDPKAAIISSYGFVLGEPGVSLLTFYDAPSPPNGIFDDFLTIPSFTKDVSPRSFLSLVQSTPSNLTSGTRAIFNTVSLTSYPVSFLEAIVNETVYWGANLILESGIYISYSVEAFLPSLFSHNTTPSAYPPSRTQSFFPLYIYYAWLLPESDQVVQGTVRTTASTLKAKAIQEDQTGVASVALYPNYAIFDTPAGDLYGANLPRLQAIKAMVDPDNVMGLTGGFKF